MLNHNHVTPIEIPVILMLEPAIKVQFDFALRFLETLVVIGNFFLEVNLATSYC